MARVIVLLMDSFGIGASQDAIQYGDEGADTFGHIVETREQQKQPLQIPHLVKLGLAHAALASTGKRHSSFDYEIKPTGLFGYAVEQSRGKDTPSGHWEIAGLPVMFNWGYFHDQSPTFPDALIQAFIEQAKLPGILGNKHASGTDIIEELGPEHVTSGKPIVYTSADSVFQIAAHEQHFGLEKLYECCNIARKLVDEYNIGRVIARPFIGEAGNYQRTINRKDLATPPHGPILFDKILAASGEVIAIGKTADIYAHQSITETIKPDGNDAIFTTTLDALQHAKNRTLIFSNFVDFDSVYGHRRNIEGYAQAIEAFDQRLPELQAQLLPGDLVIISADHGCDPTFPGSDHTREHIPVLAFGPDIAGHFIGRRESFADIGQSIAMHLNTEPLAHGVSFR